MVSLVQLAKIKHAKIVLYMFRNLFVPHFCPTAFHNWFSFNTSITLKLVIMHLPNLCQSVTILSLDKLARKYEVHQLFRLLQQNFFH